MALGLLPLNLPIMLRWPNRQGRLGTLHNWAKSEIAVAIATTTIMYLATPTPTTITTKVLRLYDPLARLGVGKYEDPSHFSHIFIATHRVRYNATCNVDVMG